jgi:drug/metabolite transporter (DMT)-like permease
VAGRNLSVPSDLVRLFRLSRVGDVSMNIGAIGVLVFGVWLAIDVDDYKLWDGWIIAALVLWALFAEVGRRVGKNYYAARDRARALVAENRNEPSPELSAIMRSQTGLVLQLVSIVIVLLFLVDMIYKPGA